MTLFLDNSFLWKGRLIYILYLLYEHQHQFYLHTALMKHDKHVM